jgi:hypothetical protein
MKINGIFRYTFHLLIGKLIFFVFIGQLGAREIWDLEHMDIRINYNELGWTIDLHHDIHGVRETDEVVIFVRDGSYEDESGARFIRPEGDAFQFLGVGAGEPFWLIPSSQAYWLVWPGIAAAGTDLQQLHTYSELDPRVSNTAARWIRVALESLVFEGSGDGHLSMWQSSNVFWSSYSEPGEGNYFYQLAGGHSHANWGFSQKGLYELGIRGSTFLAEDPETRMESPLAHIRFFVGTPLELWIHQHISAQATYPQIQRVEGHHVYSFRQPVELGNCELLVETSTNLSDWTIVATATGDGDFEQIADNILLNVADDGKVFLRAKDETNPIRFLRLRLGCE